MNIKYRVRFVFQMKNHPLWCIDDSSIVPELKHSKYGRKYGVDEEPRQALRVLNTEMRIQTRVRY